MEGVPPRENRKITVCHDGYVPDIPDSRPGIRGIHGNDLGIDCRKEIVALQHFGTRRRENSLRKYHDGIMLDARPRLMISHSGLSQRGSGMKARKRSRSKLACGVVTAMN